MFYPGTPPSVKSMKMSGGKLFRIKKEVYLNIMNRKPMNLIREFALDKIDFLNNRVKYL